MYRKFYENRDVLVQEYSFFSSSYYCDGYIFFGFGFGSYIHESIPLRVIV